MGGGSKKTLSNTKQDPWAPAQPALNQALAGATDAFNNTYNGPSVAAMDSNVTAGQNQALANANAGTISNLAGGAAGNIGDVMGNGGFAEGGQEAMTGINSALGTFNSQIGQAQSYLDPYASGQMRDNNPYLNSAIENAMSEAAASANRQFSGAGRYGSGAHSGALGSQLGNIATNARMNAYNTDTQNQLSAIGQMGNFANSGLAGNVSGYGAMAGLGQQAYGNTMAGLQALPTLNQAQNADAQTQMSIGGQRMDYNQAQIDAQNQDPWTKAGNLAQIAGAIGSLGGTSQTVSKESTGGVGGVVGGVLGGLGGLANVGKSLGGFSSLFALSDARAKENIKPVGLLNNGLNVYSYNYIGDKRPQIGLMAQEVEKVKPDAVIEYDGLKRVHYGRATED